MSDIDNPYKSPAANTEIVTPLTVRGNLTETMLKHLNDASPWLRFLGIMGFIGSGLLALCGLISLIALPIVMNLLAGTRSPLFGLFSSFGLVLVYALYFLGAGVLMFFPAFFTYRFGSKLRSYTQTNSEQELELAFKNNKSLVKFNGILMIVALAAVPVIIIVIIVVAVTVSAFT
ncbi:MAG: hypothetical protein FWF22_04265 [Treponema sp.]|nr:hypothetical protein [Treponema sp.]